MSKQAIVAFFRPSLLIAIFTAAMLSISIPAQFQRWSPDEELLMGIPKLPFYDELKPYPLKLIYAYLMIPYAIVGFTAWALWINGTGAPLPTDLASPFGVILHVIYFYVLSCFVALVYRKAKDNTNWHQAVQKIKP